MNHVSANMSSLKLLSLFLSIALINATPFLLNYQEDLVDSEDSDDDDDDEPASDDVKDPDVYRLPNNVIPLSYQLKLSPEFGNFTFSGKVKIAIHVRFDTDRIILHSKNLTIKDIQLVKKDVIKISYSFDVSNDLLIIEPAETLIYNEDYWLTIEFQGILNNVYNKEFNGFYRTSYVLDGKPRWLAVTQFEPRYARQAFPCFDELRYRTPFTIYIARDPDQSVVSNMPSEAVLPPGSLNDNRTWEKFQQSPPMPTYLVAFMVSDYKSISSDDGKIRVMIRPDAIENVTFALNQGIKLLKYLEGYTGIKYKLPKTEIIGIPEYTAGAMENWGMTTYKEQFVILNDPESQQQKIEITGMIAHEFSHFWFGNLVTPSWYSYLWLKEGFATYFQTFAAAAIEPSWNLDHVFVVNSMQSTLFLDSLSTPARAMTSPITKVSQIQGSFDMISYNKGGCVIKMLEHVVTPKTFQAALHNFLKAGEEQQYGTVTPKNLFDAFDKQIELDALGHFPPRVTFYSIMKDWTENPGFPLITVTRSYETGKITVTQTTYKSPLAGGSQPDYKWIVPLTYTTKSELQFSDTKPSHWSFANKPLLLANHINNSDWVIFNLQNTGYYRVNYDDRNWQLIIDQLSEDLTQIHPLSRAQLVGDAIVLAMDDKLNNSIAKGIWNYLKNETNLTPLSSAATSFNVLRSSIEGTSVFAQFKSFVYNLLKTPFKAIGYKIASSDSPLVKELKPIFLHLACDVGNEDCIQQSIDEYTKNQDDLSKVHPDLKEVVYCNALRYSKDHQNVFNNLWSTYTATNQSHHKRQILKTIFSCIKSEEIVKNLLSKLIDPRNTEILKKEGLQILKKMHLEIPVVTASIKFIDEKLAHVSELAEESVSHLKHLLHSLKSKIKTFEQTQLLKNLESRSSTFDQQKHGNLTQVIRNLNVDAEKNIANDANVAQHIQRNFL